MAKRKIGKKVVKKKTVAARLKAAKSPKRKVAKKAAAKKVSKTAKKKVATKRKTAVKKPAARKPVSRKARTKAVAKKKAPRRSPALEAAARNALIDCLDVKAGETVTIITDEGKRNIGLTLWQVAKALGAETVLVEMIPRSRNGEEPPAPLAALMATSSVVLCPTSMSLTHKAARREASAHGVRIATLPGITEDMMKRCLSADYQAIAERSRRLSEILQGGEEVRVVSPAGTDIKMSRGDRYPKPDTGLYHHPGEYGNLPAGETFFAPIEGTAQGTIVFEAAMAGIGKLKKPITVIVRNGRAVEITGGAEARKLNEIVDQVGPEARNIAELGIGTNDKAKVTGLILEDEKVMGTVHIALGDNKSMGGNVAVPSHLDGLIMKPTVYLDGRKIMEAGELLVQ